MKTLLIYCSMLLCLQSANAIDLTHKNFTFNVMRKQAWNSGTLPLAFVSEIEVRREVNTFTSNTGYMLLNANDRVVSEYDETSNAHEIAHFYTARNQRQHLISNFVIPNTNALISVGYDSGSRAEKISVSKTFFLGFSAFKKIDSKSTIFFMAGGWQKERIQERPCVDSYDREYWCANLTAWSDHKPITSSPLRFAEVRYEMRF